MNKLSHTDPVFHISAPANSPLWGNNNEMIEFYRRWAREGYPVIKREKEKFNLMPKEETMPVIIEPEQLNPVEAEEVKDIRWGKAFRPTEAELPTLKLKKTKEPKKPSGVKLMPNPLSPKQMVIKNRVDLIVAVDEAIKGCDYEGMESLIKLCERFQNTGNLIRRMHDAKTSKG